MKQTITQEILSPSFVTSYYVDSELSASTFCWSQSVSEVLKDEVAASTAKGEKF